MKKGWTYFIEVFGKYSVFQGRASRAEYWYFFLYNFVIFFFLRLIDSRTPLISGLYNLAVFIPSLAVGVRRMHDVNKSGWFFLIPIYNLILLIRKGDRGNNKYGPNSEPDSFIDTGNDSGNTEGGTEIKREYSGASIFGFILSLGSFLVPFTILGFNFLGTGLVRFRFFLSSLSFLIPLSSLVGIIMGIVAIRQIKHSKKKGKWLAISAIPLGALSIILLLGPLFLPLPVEEPIYSDKQINNVIKTELVSIEGGDYVDQQRYYEGKLFFEDIKNGKQYSVFLCTKKWPDLKVGTEYNLNLNELSNNTRQGGSLSGCYLGDINILINQYCGFTLCPQVNNSLSEIEARVIAEKSCIEGGESLTTGIYNKNSKTWWFDANLKKEDCNPACVVSEETKTAKLNWRCRGLKDIPKIETTDPYGRYIGKGCKIASGCNGPIECIDEDFDFGGSLCVALPEFVCYKTSTARCEKQSDNKCGWTNTPELQSCIENIKNKSQ